MKPTKYAMSLYRDVEGDAKRFISKMMDNGKKFNYAEKQYYAVKKTTYNRYA